MLNHIYRIWFNTGGYMKVVLAKDTVNEFELDLPFKSKREMQKARKTFKEEVFGRQDRGPCWEFYLQFLSESYSVDDIKPNKDRGLNFLIRKYGEENGRQRYEQRLENDRRKNTLAGFIERYGQTDGSAKYFEKNKKLSVSVESLAMNGFSEKEINEIRNTHSKKSALTLDNCISKYGENLGNKKYNEMIENRVTHWKSSYWIKKGFSEDESKKIISGLQTRDLNYFIKKYGDKEGNDRYRNFNSKRVSATRGTNVSKLENQIFSSVLKIYKDSQSTHTLGRYVVDIFVPSENLVIEVFGDYWHCNPINWSSTEYNKTLHMTAQEKWEKDKIRTENIQSQGYNVVVLWENEIKKNNFNIKEALNESNK